MLVAWHNGDESDTMAEKTKALNGKRVGVFGKGGAGKSTVVVLLAQALRDRGYEVCVLDADSTNVGLHRALGLDRSPVPLMEYFGGTVFSAIYYPHLHSGREMW